MARPERRRRNPTVAIIGSLFLILMGLGLFALIWVLAPQSDNPEGVGQVLGAAAGLVLALGVILLIWSIVQRTKMRREGNGAQAHTKR